MILGITDGVALTDRISNGAEAADILRRFFEAQITSFGAHGCNEHWQVVKTTGDGLIFLADDEECQRSKKKTHTPRGIADFLLAMQQTTAACRDIDIPLRSVIHYCDRDQLVFGSGAGVATGRNNRAAPGGHRATIDFNTIVTPGIHIAHEALQADVFGLEIIRLARIIGVAKGPFHLLTIDCIRRFLGLDPSADPDWVKRKMQEQVRGEKAADSVYSRICANIDIDPEPVGLPYIKGFHAEGKKYHVSFLHPYLVWEVTYKSGSKL